MQRIQFDSTDSTNVQARRLAGERPGEVLLVTAATQTAGRGRHGRQWHSPRGGAWLSVIWPLAADRPVNGEVALVAARAVAEALTRLAPELRADLRVEGPNDILLADRKVAGVLCEHCVVGVGPRQTALVIGVGVNVDFDLAELGGDLRRPATTLRAALGRPVAVEEVVATVADELVAALSNQPSIAPLG